MVDGRHHRPVGGLRRSDDRRLPQRVELLRNPLRKQLLVAARFAKTLNRRELLSRKGQRFQVFRRERRHDRVEMG
jgi:hypothetical protein